MSTTSAIRRAGILACILLATSAFAAGSTTRTPATAGSRLPSAADQGKTSVQPGAAATLPPLPGEQRAQPPALLDDDPTALLGLALADAWDRFGAPDSVSVVRGAQAWQDDVVFSYGPGYSFFWFRDRLWQVRLGKSYRGTILGLFMGDPMDKATALLGPANYTFSDSIAYDLKGLGYPVRVRFYFTDGKLCDAYVYRSDF